MIQSLLPSINTASLLAPLCVYFGSRQRSMEVAEISPWEAIGMVLFVFGLIELIRYGKVYFARQPYIQELRRQQPTYYNSLPQQLQRDFEKRVANFILQKTFIPRGKGFAITPEMQVRIAACATQVTFGLRPIYFSHFKKIIVYPDRYYSSIFKRYHSGEVNMRGLIVLSWNDFALGYANYNDGYNLGLHEMAHALHLENQIRNEEYDFLHAHYLRHFQRVANTVSPKIASQDENFLRLYACTDDHEFFAVCVESFFERPHKFKVEHHDLYQSLTRLLHQDPAIGYVER